MSTAIRNLKTLALIQGIVGAALSLLVTVIWNLQLGASFAVGSSLMLFNIVLLGWTWWRILAQKTIAWTLVVIVIKYAVLLGAIFHLARTSWFSSVGAGLGISSFVLAALFYAVVSEKQEKEIEEIGSDSF